MRYRQRGRRSSHGDSGSLWISFSDLMSALLLMFVLIMFYSVYQYFQMLETKSSELEAQSQKLLVQSAALEEQDAALKAAQIILAQQEAELEAAQTELETSQQSLEAAQSELQTAQSSLAVAQMQLTQAEEALIIQQAALELAQSQLTASQTALSEQETAMALSQQALLDAQTELAAQQAILAQQQTQLDQLVGVRTQIIQQLIVELSSANITGAQVDDSGAIVFQSDMMFDKNQATLKPQGKQFLDSFIPSYIHVLMKEENASYVSQIIIEGHADTDGTYLSNMQLSQSRAYAVLAYLLSDEYHGLSGAEKEWLRKKVTVNGRSSVEPVYNEEGLIDKDSSRRVVIKFRLNDETLVEDMLDVLENME